MTATLHELCEQARNTQCACGAPPGCPCVCAPGDYHLSRFSRARASGLIGMDDMASVIRLTSRMTVHDPGTVIL
jgi:hypothetical protein